MWVFYYQTKVALPLQKYLYFTVTMQVSFNVSPIRLQFNFHRYIFIKLVWTSSQRCVYDVIIR